MSLLSFKCKIIDYPKSTATPKEKVTNMYTRLHRFINILYEKQFDSKILPYTQNLKHFNNIL